MSNEIQQLRQHLTELSVEANSIVQNAQITLKSINTDIKAIAEVLNQMEKSDAKDNVVKNAEVKEKVK